MDEPQVETEIADSEPERRSGPWKLIAIVVVLTLVGIWLVPGDAPDEDKADTQQAAEGSKPPPSLLTEGTADSASAPMAPDLEVTDDRPGAMARALIAQMRTEGNIQPDRVYALGVQAQTDGQLADAYLLYFFAAREGFAPAALTLGTQADPASRDPLNSVFEAADMSQAHKWYLMAAENGDGEARERLQDLRNRVEKLAADGDTQAQRISLLWQ
jgi:TPR repeat protein